MVRVLWVFDSLSVQHVHLAAELAARSELELEVMCRWDHEPPLDPARIPTTRLICHYKIDWRARQTIRRQLKAGRYDIVHAYSSKNFANVIGACWGLKPRPHIVGYRGTVNRLDPLDPANWITFWHPRVSKILCVCHATQRALRASGVKDSKLVPMWEGCAPETLDSLGRDARAEFNIPVDAIVVGSVANMRPVKGMDLLLRAALELPDLGNIYWLVIGQVHDPRVAKLAADPRIRDRVRLPGFRSDARRYAGLMDLYVAPSRMEGLSMAIMEAMAQGVCPIVSDAGGNPELVENGISGIVVPRDDVTALAGAIRTLHGDPQLRRHYAANALDRIRQEFTIRAWADRLDTFYRSLQPIHS